MRNSDPAGNGTVVEWAPFRLARGVEESALLEASELLQRDFLRHQAGFVRRELLRGRDGQWVDLVIWKDESSVMGAMSAAGSSAPCRAYFKLMEGGGEAMAADTGMLLLHPIRVY